MTTDSGVSIECRNCAKEMTDRPGASPFGFQRYRCPNCNSSFIHPLTNGWRITWWFLAIVTVAAGVYANATLHQGYSWIPKAMGIVAFAALWVDVWIRFRMGRAVQTAVVLAPVESEIEAPDPHVGPRFVADSPGYVAGLTVATVLTLLASAVGALVVAGLNNGYSFDVVAQEARAATTKDGFSGALDLVVTSDRICGGGEDYRSCVTMHVAMYNSLCVGDPLNPASLSATAAATCSELLSFIDDVEARLSTCGSGCTTRTDENDRWGWAYLRPTPVEVSISNDNNIPEIVYQEHCLFELGPIHLGSCPGTPAS